jgi:magnesium-transporting ATPase (P-type)
MSDATNLSKNTHSYSLRFGRILFFIGLLVGITFILGGLGSPETVFQQTIQTFRILIDVIFIIGSFIVLFLYEILKTIVNMNNKSS